MVRPAESAEKVEIKTRSDLRAWLEANYHRNKGVWVVKYKKPHEYYLPYNDDDVLKSLSNRVENLKSFSAFFH